MSRTGRPPKLRLWLALLERLPNETVGEIVRSGSFTRPQLTHYLRELTRRGYVAPNIYLSHAYTDGPGAKRYSVTGAGRDLRRRLRERESRTFAPPLAPTGPASESPARAEPRPAPRPEEFTPTSLQVVLGTHNLCYVMVVEERFRRPFYWPSSHPMRGGWVSRHSPFGKGVHLEEAGGSRWDPPGSAGHKILVKVAPLKGEDAEENLRRAGRIAWGVRRTLEQEYGCTLSDPVLRSRPKHSVGGDPYARELREAGVAVRGPEEEVDDTPEPATLEFHHAKRLNEYVDGVRALPKLLEAIESLRVQTEANTLALTAIAESSGEQSKILREILARTPKPPEPKPPAPLVDVQGAGYG